ncbi:MAG: GAF domain-containing protein [Spirochaetes bacterium]|nr:GAF domain-containing protein [Spirochaetota bacterium]
MKKKFSGDIDIIRELLEITENLSHNKDIVSLLDNILYEARKFTNADAGTIFLREENELNFSYFQNDTLTQLDENNKKFIYANSSIPINDESIAGYVANSSKPLLINDVYKLNNKVPYSFNDSFDKQSNYSSKSFLTVPLITSRDQTIGVMQIINAKDENDQIIPFTQDDLMYVSFFANNASVAIERAQMTQQIILRMISMAELRDPKETGAHVNRVGSYTIEIYQKWAKNHNIDEKTIKAYKDVLRLASMLHDVGKVAISDTILKKPGRLTDEEYDVMKTHTVHGAELFKERVSDWDKVSSEIAIHHHEKWDGTGYPYQLKGEEIPISGRITALADVYDALISRRVYKEAWDEKKVLELIESESGKHFDPEVVKAFFSIYDIIKAIREKFPDKE